MQKLHGTRWTALKVFTVNNMSTIKAEIERENPEVKGSSKGYFKHYPKYKSRCFQALTEDERVFYEDMAEDWNWNGATTEIKRR